MQSKLFDRLVVGPDGIYSSSSWSSGQEREIELRKEVANKTSGNLHDLIATHHSFSVMDAEVKRFVEGLPQNGVILDVGGCWGWHWRKVSEYRPDVKIVIIDLVRENLSRAQYFLGDKINKTVFLVHGDGTRLPFDDNTFDGYWSVQTLQHIPSLKEAVSEAYRVLKTGGLFSMYNLNNPIVIKCIHKMLGRNWIEDGVVEGMFYLRRSGTKDAQLIKQVFGNVTSPKYTEILFKPELNLHGPGSPTSWLGHVDAFLSSRFPIFGLVARQRSYSAVKAH